MIDSNIMGDSIQYGRSSVLRKVTVLISLLFLSASGIAAKQTVIAVIGDSLVHGYGLHQEDGFVPQLEKWLKENGEDVRLLNAGVSGDTTSGGLARLDWTITSEVNAVVVLLGGNDALRGIFPEETRKNLDGILMRLTERNLPVLLIGLEAPDNFGPDYKRQFEAIFPDLAEKYDVLLYPRFFEAIDSVEDRNEARRRYLQEDMLHPNETGVQKIVSSVGGLVSMLVHD